MSLNSHTREIVQEVLTDFFKLHGRKADVLSLGVPEVQGWDNHRKFFAKFNAKSITTMDVVDWEGCDFVFDLNKPLSHCAPENKKYIRHYDIIIDPGTLEHVFNCAEAVRTVYKLLKPNGIAVHHNPLNWLNHGYHNFSPCFLREFYEDNGCEVIQYLRKGNKRILWNPKPHLTIRPTTPLLLVTVAKKKARSPKEPEFPQQRRYTQGNWKKGKK